MLFGCGHPSQVDRWGPEGRVSLKWSVEVSVDCLLLCSSYTCKPRVCSAKNMTAPGQDDVPLTVPLLESPLPDPPRCEHVCLWELDGCGSGHGPGPFSHFCACPRAGWPCLHGGAGTRVSPSGGGRVGVLGIQRVRAASGKGVLPGPAAGTAASLTSSGAAVAMVTFLCHRRGLASGGRPCGSHSHHTPACCWEQAARADLCVPGQVLSVPHTGQW